MFTNFPNNSPDLISLPRSTLFPLTFPLKGALYSVKDKFFFATFKEASAFFKLTFIAFILKSS